MVSALPGDLANSTSYDEFLTRIDRSSASCAAS